MNLFTLSYLQCSRVDNRFGYCLAAYIQILALSFTYMTLAKLFGLCLSFLLPQMSCGLQGYCKDEMS